MKFMLANAARELEKDQDKTTDKQFYEVPPIQEENSSDELVGMEKIEAYFDCCDAYREHFNKMYEENKEECYVTPNVSLSVMKDIPNNF